MNPAPELKPWWSETWRTWSEHVGGCRHELARLGDPRANVARQRGRRLLLRASPKRQQRQPPQSGRRGLQTRGEVSRKGIDGTGSAQRQASSGLRMAALIRHLRYGAGRISRFSFSSP